MNYSNSIFKFATIRNASDLVKESNKKNIQPKTALTSNLVDILTSEKNSADKISAINQKLDLFIKSDGFYKTTTEIEKQISKLLATSTKETKIKNDELKKLFENLYDNIVIRTITKSNANSVFALLIQHIKEVNIALNHSTVKETDIQIILPKGLNISLQKPKPIPTSNQNNSSNQAQVILKQIEQLTAQKKELHVNIESIRKNIITEQGKINTRQTTPPTQSEATVKATKANAKRTANFNPVATTDRAFTIAQDNLMALHDNIAIHEASVIDIGTQLQDLHTELVQYIRPELYTKIGDTYVKTNKFDTQPPLIEEDGITVFEKDCSLKYPFQIADLRVVEQKVVGYLPNEIAHINNTQPGELHEKITRRLKRIETFESLISEDEITKETDTQSTEKFSLEKAASQVQSEETNVNVNASVSGTYGVVTASLDAGFSHSESSQNSNSSSQSYAKEVVQKVVDRVSHKVRSERSIKSLEEFEETVKHVIDNTGGESGTGDKGPKSFVYRWLEKIVRATLKNYGKRLILQLDIAHPSHYYVSRSLKQPEKVEIPIDPRKWDDENNLPAFTIQNIRRDNYSFWEKLYDVKLEAPPVETKIVSSSEIKNGTIDIPEGYEAKKAFVSIIAREAGDSQFYELSIVIGRKLRIDAYRDDSWGGIWENFEQSYLLDNEIIKLPLAVMNQRGGGLVGNIEVECKVTEKLMIEWQTKCYFSIIEAYENLKTEAESKMSEFNPNNPGLNPARKNSIVTTELKKGAIQKMFRCNPFYINDKYVVGVEYTPECCADNLNAEKARFLETTFDWKNMTYELYPYFYNSHTPNSPSDNWSKLLDLKDDDPHFEAFLQASYATVHIPVHREPNKEKAALNFIINNSIGNFSVLPDGIQNLLDDLDNNTPFGVIDETSTTIPFIRIIKEYDKLGNVFVYYKDSDGAKVICTEVNEFDKEGNKTNFYYNTTTNQMVISEIKEGYNDDGQKYNYYFNSANEKIVTHKTKTEYNIDGTSQPYYATDLGIFNIPTDLVILEKGVQEGIEVNGYPEDKSDPTSDIIIPKQYSPAIIQK